MLSLKLNSCTYILCLLVGVFRSFTFNVLIDIVGFKSFNLLFVFNLSQLFFVQLIFSDLFLTNCIFLWWQFFSFVSSFTETLLCYFISSLWFIVYILNSTVYLQVIFYQFTYRIRALQKCTSSSPFLAFVLLFLYILFLHVL